MNANLFFQDLMDSISPLSDHEASRLEVALAPYNQDLSELSAVLYERLSKEDRSRFLLWFAKRWAAIQRVPEEELREYQEQVDRINSFTYEYRESGGSTYRILNLAPQGYQGELMTYPWMSGVHDFLFDQYQTKQFRVQPGDIIIDAGAFVGDTALLFSQVTKGDCEIHAFEVLEENLKLLRHNLDTNGLAGRVRVCPLALSDSTGDSVYIKTHSYQGATSIFGGEQDTKIETITLDDYIANAGINRIDLIKMDIEGAERMALSGALNTIRRDRPRLAICIYHLWDDPLVIPKLIESTGVPYIYQFKWVELRNGWEAVLLCTPS